MPEGTPADQTPAEGTPARPRGRTRRLGNALIALGVCVLLYAGLILAWGDPVTWLWAHWQQRALTSEFHRQQRQFIVTTPPADSAAAKTLVRNDAIAFSKSLKEGHAFGRLTIARIGLSKVVVVQGTTAGIDADLSKGPGHYMNTPFPGLGGSVAIAQSSMSLVSMRMMTVRRLCSRQKHACSMRLAARFERSRSSVSSADPRA